MTSAAVHNAALADAARVVCRWCAAGLPRADGRHHVKSGASIACRAAGIWGLEKKKEKKCPNQ